MRNTLLAMALVAGLAAAQTPGLERMMRVAEAAWSRGDLDAFVVDYEDSPETTFIGRTVTRGGRPEDFGRKKPASARVRRRLARTAQLHRRLVYAPAAAVPFHWLALLPLAVLRSVGLLFAKRPGAVAGEFGAWLKGRIEVS